MTKNSAYKKQHHVERGYSELKDPLFFASSLFVKTPARIMGLLMVMLLSLLVSGIAERRLGAALKEQQETLPNQIGVQTSTPTLRWVFQLLEGINYLKISLGEQVDYVIDGLNALREKILRLFGEPVMTIYSDFFRVVPAQCKNQLLFLLFRANVAKNSL